MGYRISLCLALVGLATSVNAQSTPVPLRLSFECDRSQELTFRFTLQNVSTSPTAAVIGVVLGNDKKCLPDSQG
jgi:hypothetical protein